MFVVVAVSLKTGHQYNVPETTFPQYGFPQSINLNGNMAQLRHVGEPSLQHGKDISYSISYSDYLYLKRHKTKGQDSPFNPERPPEGTSQRDNRYLVHYAHRNGNTKISSLHATLNPTIIYLK